MIKQFILFLAFLTTPFVQLFSQEKGDSIDMIYGKVGTELGAGYRSHQKYGYDLSVNGISVILSNWASAKALFLAYPWYERDNFFYGGLGGGLTYEYNVGFGLVDPHVGSSDSHRTYPTAEGVLGYEFRTDKKIKMFLQLEAGVPLTSNATFPIIPALTFGIGF